MTKDEALRLALQLVSNLQTHSWTVADEQYIITAIKAALEAKDEPVAWMFQHEETGRTMCVDAQQLEWGFEKGNPRLKKIAPLYTTLPQRTWLGLTQDELNMIGDRMIMWNSHSLADIYVAIEAKLKEKNK